MTLRDRCREMVGQMQRDAMLRQNDPVESLVAFVQSEIGRTADGRLEDCKSLVLYFADEDERREFVEAVREAKPGMVLKNLP